VARWRLNFLFTADCTLKTPAIEKAIHWKSSEYVAKHFRVKVQLHISNQNFQLQIQIDARAWLTDCRV